MSSNNNNNNAPNREPTEFEIRRSELVAQIGDSLEQVLTQLNAFNRSLEGIIEIGNEFAAVEALWSQFETVLGNNPSTEDEPESKDEDERNAGNQ